MSKRILLVMVCLILPMFTGIVQSRLQQEQQNQLATQKTATPRLLALSPDEAKAIGNADLLFVQKAMSVAITKDKMILKVGQFYGSNVIYRCSATLLASLLN